MEKPPKNRIISGAAAILSVGVVALAGSLLVNTQSEWYLALNKPQFQPPSTVFFIVWMLLYALIAISITILVLKNTITRGLVVMFAVNGLLQLLWNFIFFQLCLPVAALAVLLGLVVQTLLLVRQTLARNGIAGWILVPYAIWIVFAFVLNYVISMIN